VKIASIVGNRPQFIKAGPTSVALREHGLDEVVIHTGQHYDRELSQVFFEELGLAEPRHRLDLRTADPEVMRPPIEACLSEEHPDWVLVYGDTNSTLAGALAATALELPLAHVEAGLRSGDLSMPEERNRIETDRLAQLLLCPDERSREILASEGVAGHADVVGDVMADACFRLTPIALSRSRALDDLALQPSRYLLLTVHREANTRQPRLRPSTEWVDTVETGANVLVDDDPDRLVAAVAEARMPLDRPQLYGDGHAAKRIAQSLVRLHRA